MALETDGKTLEKKVGRPSPEAAEMQRPNSEIHSHPQHLQDIHSMGCVMKDLT